MNRLFIPSQSVNEILGSRVHQAAGISAVIHIRNRSSGDERKKVKITRIYNDKDGKSHFGTIKVELKGSGKVVLNNGMPQIGSADCR